MNEELGREKKRVSNPSMRQRNQSLQKLDELLMK